MTSIFGGVLKVMSNMTRTYEDFRYLEKAVEVVDNLLLNDHI